MLLLVLLMRLIELELEPPTTLVTCITSEMNSRQE